LPGFTAPYLQDRVHVVHAADDGRVRPFAVDEIPEGKISGDRQAVPMLVEGIHEVEKDPGLEVAGFQRIGLSYVV
jgi:hypothetical protein